MNAKIASQQNCVLIVHGMNAVAGVQSILNNHNFHLNFYSSFHYRFFKTYDSGGTSQCKISGAGMPRP